MFKHYFERIEHIEIWPVMALIIFFLFFTGLLIYTYKLDKKYVREMENMPLESDDHESNSNP